MNEVRIIGRLASDITLYEPSGEKNEDKCSCQFIVVINQTSRNGKTHTYYIPCVAFNETAIALQKDFQKGNLVFVYGHLQQNTAKKDNVAYLNVVVHKIKQARDAF